MFVRRRDRAIPPATPTPALNTHSIGFRRATAADESFLVSVYASTRQEEMALVPWPDAAKRAFLLQQFQVQAADWARVYPRAQREIILLRRTPVGRLYINRDAAERNLHIIDIAVLPGFRGQGVGRHTFQRLFAETDAAGWSVSLQVERQNPIYRWYVALGFTPTRQNGSRLGLRRAAPAPAKPAPLSLASQPQHRSPTCPTIS